MSIPWSDKYSLGIKIIDDQHRIFVAILNRVYNSIDALTPNTELETIIDDLNQHSLLHHTTEEEYFQKFDYPLTGDHTNQHRDFEHKLAAIDGTASGDHLASAFSLADLMEDWLIKHMSTVDRKYVDYFHEHGLY